MRVNRELVFKVAMDEIEEEMREREQKLEETKGEYNLLKILMLTLTPEMIVKKLKKPENKNAFIVYSRLVKGVGEVKSLNQIMTAYDTEYDLENAYEILMSSQKVGQEMQMGSEIVDELCKMFLNVDAFSEVRETDEFSFVVQEILHDIVLDFISNEITSLVERTNYLEFGLESMDFVEDYEPSIEIEYFPDNSPFWLVYEALLDNEEAVEEGCKMFKKYKMELALDGKPVKFEEEQK